MLTKYKRLTFLLLALSTSMAQADNLRVKNAWIPEAPPVSQVLAGYMVIENTADEIAEIIAVESPDFDSIEMHLSKEVNGIAKMLPQKSLIVAAHSLLELKPGGYHLMLLKPKKKLRDGDMVEFTISLAKGSVSTVATVKKAGSTSNRMKCGAGKCGGSK